MEKGTLESLLCIPPSGRGPTHLDGANDLLPTIIRKQANLRDYIPTMEKTTRGEINELISKLTP